MLFLAVSVSSRRTLQPAGRSLGQLVSACGPWGSCAAGSATEACAGACWPARRFVKRPGVIDVVIGKPIATEGREARELTEEVQNWIRQALPR